MQKPHAILSLIIVFALSGCGSASDELRIVKPATDVDAGIAADLTSLIDENSRISVQLTDSPLAGQAAIDALSAGSADIALVSNNLPFRDDIATVMPLYKTVLHIAYLEGRDATSHVELLRNARVYAGPEGSASRLIFTSVVKGLGLEEHDYSFIADDSEKPDVVIIFAPISPERMAEFPEYRLYSLGVPDQINTGTALDGAVLLNPRFTHFVIPARTYGDSTPEAIVTVAVDKIIVARSNLDRSVVYELIDEILRLRPALASRYPGLFPALLGDFDASRSTFKLHAGTQDYLQRSEPTIYERYSGVAEVVVTLLIGLISVGIASLRLYQMRRKNRIDSFYLETIELRNSISEHSSPEERRTAIRRVNDLQTKAFEMLVDEKLAADESFRIFITLSKDVLHQLKTDE